MIQLTYKSAIQSASLCYLSLFQFLRFKNKLWNRGGTLRSRFSSALEADCRLSQTMETFPFHRWWKKSWKRFSANRRLVVGTEIDSVEVEKFSSCVELECGTTLAGCRRLSSSRREVLMAHFPASPSMSRLAGLCDTQNVCRMAESRNRNGSRVWRKSSAHRPPARAIAAAGGDSKDPEVHSAVKVVER